MRFLHAIFEYSIRKEGIEEDLISTADKLNRNQQIHNLYNFGIFILNNSFVFIYIENRPMDIFI